MKKLSVAAFAFALVFAFNVAVVTPAHAESSSISALAETLKTLLAKVADLQAQIAKARGEVQDARQDVREALKDGLKEGMTDEDIKEIQEILATDPQIYPEGLKTGYFGSLTKNALKRFQQKHSLNATGEIDEETKELLEEYLNERFDGKVPTGLWRAPGIYKKVHDRVCERRAGKWLGFGLFCKDWSNDDDEDEDEGEAEDVEEFELEIEVDDNETTASFTYEGEEYTVEVSSARESRVLTAFAREIGIRLYKLDEDFVSEVKEKLAKAIEDEDHGSEEDAEEAIDKADEEIDEVQNDIDNAADGVDTDEAQDMLDEAVTLLEDAEEAFADDNFDDAEELADQAAVKADEAYEILQDAIEDAD